MFLKGLFSLVVMIGVAVVAVILATGDTQRGVIWMTHKALTLKAQFSANPRGLPADCIGLEEFLRLGQKPTIGTDSEEVQATRTMLEGLEAFFPLSDCAVTETSANGIKAYWVTKKESARDRKTVMVYLHGGGYAAGSIRSYKHFSCELATATNAAVFFVEYSLAPEKLHPGSTQEAVTAIQWLYSEGGVDMANVVIAGDSAGGGMSLLVTQKLVQLKAPLPAAVVVISPWSDLTCTAESIKTNAANDFMVNPAKLCNQGRIVLGPNAADAANPQYSPLFGSFAGFPPLYISVGTAETLLDDSVSVAKKAKAEGVKVVLSETPHMQHVAPFLRHFCSDGEAEFQKIVRFVKSELKL